MDSIMLCCREGDMVKRMSKTRRKPANGTAHKRANQKTCLKNSETLCAVSDRCGGCSCVNVPYGEQLKGKDEQIAELFSDVQFAQAEIRLILGMQDPLFYRDKVTAPFAPGKRGRDGSCEIITGMYAAGSHRIIQTKRCLVENERAQEIVKAICHVMKTHHVAPYDEVRGTGFLRHAIIRVGHESGEVLVTLVTNEEMFRSSKSFCRDLVKRCPFITSIVQNVNTRQTNVILGEKEQRLYGPGFIIDSLCGLTFRISSQSFYQVNARQTAVLYEEAISLAELDGSQSVIDAYCGTGTIGLVAAKKGAARVLGVDSVASSIRDARENARHNGVENASFTVADAGEYLHDIARQGEHVDVVLMDPPRAGSSEAFLDALAALGPSRVVYISCNPRTQVRDIAYLQKRGYRLSVVQPVDMFPHTDHIESIAQLLHI